MDPADGLFNLALAAQGAARARGNSRLAVDDEMRARHGDDVGPSKAVPQIGSQIVNDSDDPPQAASPIDHLGRIRQGCTGIEASDAR